MEKKTLQTIFSAYDAEIPPEIASQPVHGIHFDSRKVEPGDLFVAVRGFKTDGHDYLPQAQQAGALAAVVESVRPEIDLPQIRVPDTRYALALLSAELYREAIESLKLAGVTGTNGKTSVAFLIRSMLDAAGQASGLMGTIAYYYGSKQAAAWNTTPEASDIARMLTEMVQNGQKAAVLEVSSHALALQRVEGLRFDAAVFTNLTRDHLDFHKTEEAYFMAKAHLFDLLKPKGVAVLNLDDPFGRRLSESLNAASVTFGFNPRADVRVESWRGDISGTELHLKIGTESLQIHSNLIGAFNVANLTAAAATGVALQLDFQAIAAGLEQVRFVPGRLQAYALKKDVTAVIDYAHTPDALEKALQALRPLTKGRLLVLFGAGGDRDTGKRPLMGQIAETQADLVIVTTDNPRTEEPEAIIKDILTGMSQPDKRIVLTDRREAIAKAVTVAQPGDVLLIAGKGHETYQEINGVKYDFNEADILLKAANHV